MVDGQVAAAGQERLGSWLLGSEAQRVLQSAATAAIQATAREFRPGLLPEDDVQAPEHLARIIDRVFRQAPTPAESLTDHATLLQGMHAGVAARLTVLEDPDITEMGQSSAALLGISVPLLADVLTKQLLREIIVRGASGEPIAALATQLNHDLTHLQSQVVSDAGDGVEAVAATRRLQPDVVLMDIRMPNLDGLQATKQIMAAGSGSRVVILTTFDLDEYVYQALAAGASGFLLKNAPPEQLISAVRVVAAGDGCCRRRSLAG